MFVIRDVTVLVLDRPRHADLIQKCRAAGARIKLISDGDVGGAIEVAKDEACVDVLMGIGGTPEGVIAGGCRDDHSVCEVESKMMVHITREEVLMICGLVMLTGKFSPQHVP